MEVRKQITKPLYDPMIIPRVKQYLEENVHQTYVDVGVMARHLQEKYREYARRKSVPFRFLVDQAYKTVLRSYGLDSNPSSEEDEDDEDNSDLEVMDDAQTPRNTMNNMLTNLYANAKGNATKEVIQQNEGELVVDISSDEGDSEEPGKINDIAAPDNLNLNRSSRDILRLANDLTLTRKVIPVATQKDQTQQPPVKNDIAKLPADLFIKLTPPLKKRKVDGKAAEGLNNGQTIYRNINRENSVPLANKSSRKREYPTVASNVSFKDLGGADKILKELCELLLHIKHPCVYKHIGLQPPRGFLLTGAPGTGKTLLAQAIAGQLHLELIQVAATELIGGVSGESEERIRDLFDQAAAMAPCVLFIDEIDAISSNRLNAQKDMERRIVAQLIASLDGLSKHDNSAQIVVIGATNRVDAIDPALRRVGRFDHEISLGIPDREARSQILRVICSNLRLEKFFDYDAIATLTPGYVGADLLALATRAASLAVKRIFQEKEENALKRSVSKSTANPPIPMINLTDDILMEIDSVLDCANQDKDVADKAEEGEVTAENKDKEETGVADTNTEAEKKPGDADDNNEKDEEITKDNVPVEKGETEQVKENTESNNVDENKMEEGEVPTSKEEVEQEPEKSEHDDAEKMQTTDGKETLGDALLKNDEIKNKLGLHVMFKWLSDVEPLITADELKDLFITMKDFEEATKVVQPSAKREGFITVPDVTWDDIGSLKDIRQELSLAVLAPVKYPERLKSLGLQAPSGVLLCGPPGCGKTLLAKAIANEAGINFISVKGPELLNMYVGESERAVRQCFQRARNSVPCVIFFDEFDALCPKRTDSSEGSASSRVVNQLLTEMDGVEGRNGVFLMAATNRPDIIDPAVIRPGRLDKILYVGLPDVQDRLDILRAITKKGTEPTLDDDVNLSELAKLTESYTGADLAGLVQQAARQSLKDSLANEDISDKNKDEEEKVLKVNKKHFSLALQNLRPSISKEDKIRYEKLRQKYAAVPDQ